ncbi:MAG: NAD-dependent epimerase/dehydratase family protein [Armatimonadetes bacterium]|nr:NAD-dependent epimerase/dehydratase family protein [Armatimonadota bacterium]
MSLLRRTLAAVTRGLSLITGVHGFIGSHLAARLLQDGAPVRGLDIVPRESPGIEFVQADLTRPETLVGAVDGCEIVFHCTRWPGQPRTWEAAHAVEVTGTANLFEACRRAGVARVVHISSVAVYGPTHAAVITEETPLWAAGVYGRSKVEAERCVQEARRSGLPIVTLRPGQVYGPRAAGGTLEPIRWLMTGRPVLVNGGRGVNHPVYISNLIDALIATATADGIEGQAFNIADGNVPWREFYGHYARMTRRPLRSLPASVVWLSGMGSEAFGWLTSRPPALDRASVTYLTRRSAYSIERARTVLRWSPAISMDEAMAETERWLRSSGVLRV